MISLDSWTIAVAAVAGCAIAILVAAYLLVAPVPHRLPIERRRPGVAPSPGLLSSSASAATSAIEKVLGRSGDRFRVTTLERAGVKMPRQDFTLLVIVAALAGCAVGLLLGGPLLGIALVAAVPVGAKILLTVRASRRQRSFADQLDDSLQLMASSLRAGHSLLQALAAVSREAEVPTSEEFARIINETRVGRELGASLAETAERMQSEDFNWVTQAIAINREVGGNLAEVLDGVGHTIRERAQIRRQVKALSAEGKLSALVLMALPFGIVGFLSLVNPGYLAKFTESIVGYGLIGIAVLLLIVGGLWLAKVVQIKF